MDLGFQFVLIILIISFGSAITFLHFE